MLEDTSIDIITVIPRNQYKFKYIINDGSSHTIRKENLYEFLKDFINITDKRKVLDFIQRFRPFIILVGEKKIIELMKEDDNEYYTEELKEEMNSISRKYRNNIEKTEIIPNDDLLYLYTKKMETKKV